jgi:7-keto-8-aminopelargonate synthetase-like enzyme
MVDEAHATGIFGKNGSGLAEEDGLSNEIEVIMGTFGKAIGGFGAYLAASKETVDYLINTCRSFIYSTALPPAVLACDLAAIELVRNEPHRRRILLETAGYFRKALDGRGVVVTGDSQITPLIVGDSARASDMAGKLREKGFWILPVRPPTVPPGTARLRISLCFGHEKEVLDRLIDAIGSMRFYIAR